MIKTPACRTAGKKMPLLTRLAGGIHAWKGDRDAWRDAPDVPEPEASPPTARAAKPRPAARPLADMSASVPLTPPEPGDARALSAEVDMDAVAQALRRISVDQGGELFTAPDEEPPPGKVVAPKLRDLKKQLKKRPTAGRSADKGR